MLIYGLDFHDTPRFIHLRKLSEAFFLVDQLKVLEFPALPFKVNIALSHYHPALLEKTLLSFQEQDIDIHAVDIESNVLARALQLLCDIKDKTFAILYITSHKISFSIFENFQKIFFYSENIFNHNIKEIIHRAFKISDIIYQNCYVIGEYPESSEWGIIPDLSQKLKFNSLEDEQLFKKENTRWLLACGLSLWNKEGCINLLSQPKNKSLNLNLNKSKLKIMIIFLLLIFSLFIYFFPRHQTPQPSKITELELIKSGTIYQDGHLWEIIKNSDQHIYLSKKR